MKRRSRPTDNKCILLYTVKTDQQINLEECNCTAILYYAT